MARRGSSVDERLVQFIAGLRGAGVRVSLAESQDAALGTRLMGAADRSVFMSALRTTLIKQKADRPIFDKLFPMYFSTGSPPMLQASDALSPDEIELLRAALRRLSGELQELLSRLLEAEPLTDEELRQATLRAGLEGARRPSDGVWLTQQTLRELSLSDLMERVEELLKQLAEIGLDQGALQELRKLLRSNAQVLASQVGRFVAASLAERLREHPRRRMAPEALLDRPFHSLRASESEELRRQVARLAAKLRTRASLRQKRGKGRRIDAKSTLRANVRYGGVPFEIIHRERRLKAKFTILCDVSTSMRPVVGFLLLLVYHLQDQVARTRSFAYIDHIEEISPAFAGERPERAVAEVLEGIPPGHYNTDLGQSLDQFVHRHLDCVDRRTTVILCGDARNNYNPSRTDLVARLRRRARRLVWFNPEPPALWGSDDSDMPLYAPLVDCVYAVATLRQLTEAVDQLFH